MILITNTSRINGMFRYITNKVDKVSAALVLISLCFTCDEGEGDLG